MKNILLLLLLLISIGTLSAQEQVYGYWVGIITEGHEQFKFEINISTANHQDPTVLDCRTCRKLKGEIIDHRELEKSIDFFGIINGDQSINLIDSKFALRQTFDGEIRTKYQIGIEIKNGAPWLVGYYQDYNAKGRKVRQGKIYLKRKEPIDPKA